MNIKQYFSTYQGLQAENRWNRLVTLGLVALCLGETVMLAIRPTVVTIQPWTLTRDAQVTESNASQSYIEAWGLALSELLGNVTPSNVNFIAERLGPLLDPKIYHQVIDAVHANAEELKNDRVTMRFEPRRVKFERVRARFSSLVEVMFVKELVSKAKNLLSVLTNSLFEFLTMRL